MQILSTVSLNTSPNAIRQEKKLDIIRKKQIIVFWLLFV